MKFQPRISARFALRNDMKHYQYFLEKEKSAGNSGVGGTFFRHPVASAAAWRNHQLQRAAVPFRPVRDHPCSGWKPRGVGRPLIRVSLFLRSSGRNSVPGHRSDRQALPPARKGAGRCGIRTGAKHREGAGGRVPGTDSHRGAGWGGCGGRSCRQAHRRVVQKPPQHGKSGAGAQSRSSGNSR